MKKAFLVLPLAIVLANCSSTRNSNSSSASSSMNTSAAATAGTGLNADASASGSMSSSGSTASVDAGSSAGTTRSGSGSMSSSNSGSSGMSSSGSTNSGSNSANSANWNSNPGSTSGSYNKNSSTARSSSGTINWDVYDPNNYMQNPEKYRKPYELGKTGGWTYNKDWRRNTNFTAEAVGQWQLMLTPEVAANWMPDTRRPETYASFWTPEAVMARYQANMAAAQRTQDSIAALNATASANTTTTGRSRRGKYSLANRSNSGTTGMTASSRVSGGTWASGSGTTGTVGSGGSASVSGSGTTGTMGTGGSSSLNTDANASAGSTTGTTNNATIPFSLTAVNGNNFMLPSLNLHIDNGSFTAYTGCNNAVGTIVVNGSALHFEEAAPSSNVECIGGFDQSAFLDRLRRADSYDVVNNQFRLKQGDQVLMVFQKNGM